MFHVKVKVLPSNINGLGLFAEENIAKEQLVYSKNDKLDLTVSVKEFENLSLDEKRTIKHYGFLDKKENIWHVSFDDIRFCNHSFQSNITNENKKLIATKDIKKGDEITQNYEEFEILRKEVR